jgi:hypothetical protein
LCRNDGINEQKKELSEKRANPQLLGNSQNELILQRPYATRDQAIREIRECIGSFYNRKQDKKLSYLSPAAYQQKLYAGKLAA